MPSFNLTMQELGHPYPNPGTGTVSGHQVELMYHHIVPKSARTGLIRLWNLALERGHLSAAKPLLSAISQYVDKYGTTLVPADRQHVKNIANGIKNGSCTHDAARPRPDGWDNFAQVYVWLPGNLFCGPRNRVDDPGEGFDAPAAHILGPTTTHYQKLQTVFDELTKYLADPAKIGYAETAFDYHADIGRSYLGVKAFAPAQWTWDTGRNGPKVKGS